MGQLGFFTSIGGELLYNFLYLIACLIVIFMLSYQWKLTKDKLYLLTAFVVMFFNLIFTNVSLAHEVFLNIKRSRFWFPAINWNLEALSLIFLTWAFLYPTAREKKWLKKYLTYNIFLLVLSFSIITPIWLNSFFRIPNFRDFWGAYYYNIWLLLLLTFTVCYLHYNRARYNADMFLRMFVGVLFLQKVGNFFYLINLYPQIDHYLITLDRSLPLLASFLLVSSIYRNIVYSLIQTNKELCLVQQKLNESHQQLEKKVRERTHEISDKNIELLRFKEFHENLLKSLTNGIVVVDNQGLIMAVNKALEDNFSLKAKKIIGRPITQVLPIQSRQDWSKLLDRIIRSGKNIQLPKLKYKSEQLPEEIITNVIGQPLKDKENKNIGVVFTLEFITEKVKLMEQVKRSERLAYAGQLAAGMAHEIRNPLNSMSINLQLLKRALSRFLPETSTNIDNTFKVMGSEISRLDTIVNEFIHYAKPKRIKLKSKNINEIVGQTISLINKQASMTNIQLRQELDESLPPIPVDEDRIKQVFLNISINSMQAMAKKGGEIRFKTRFCHSNGRSDLVQICISDCGPGIAKPQQNKIFEPFFSTKDDGIGLGLAIAQRIIEEHKGQIAIESQLGKGTTFIISLPSKATQD
jgi:PAS domain S-box-containing protein